MILRYLHYLREVSTYYVVAVHGDGGSGGIDIGNSTHSASPVDKTVASIWSGHQVNHRAR